MKIHTRAFALACGILTGFGVFLFTWKLIALGGTLRKDMMPGRFFRRFRVTPVWSIAGFAGGFINGYLGGALFSWMYNRMVDALGGEPEEGEERREHRHYHHLHEHDHIPWLFALAHRVPGIHA